MSRNTPTPSVTFAMSPPEFKLLATFMAPLHFDESNGESVWVSRRVDGSRTWTAHANGTTSVIEIRDGIESLNETDPWAFPIPENLLIAIGKIFLTYDEVIVTLSDDTATIATDEITITVAQNPHAHQPAIPPMSESVCEVSVDASNLWIVLTTARMWPAGGDGNGMNPPLVCTFDIEKGLLRLSADWTTIGLGIHQFDTKAEFGNLEPGAFLPRFNFPHSALLDILRDPVAAGRMSEITIHANTTGEGFILLEGDNWKLHVPALADVDHWGHDLDAVIGGIDYEWANSTLVHVLSPELTRGVIELRALPAREGGGPFKYRVSYELLNDVVPTLDLYNELNSLNEGAAGCRLVVDGNRVVALSDLTQENYELLESHVNAFARDVSALPPLLGALDGGR
ncbi:MAG: hypothetical protein FJW09_09310 [Actinobacteria bacterium]|nr:hypothetical protein [Actinomycetota bacterium]